MHTISKFFTVLIILMVLIPSTIAAPNENANPKAGLKIVDMSKGTLKEIKDDKVKGIKSSSNDIVVDEKGKNSIKLKDSKPSKVPNEHKKVKVSIPASELQKIDVDNDGVFGVLEIADDDTVIGQWTATTAQLVAGDVFTFSDVEINGFSGYREETFTGVGNDANLNIVDVSGSYIQTASVTGTVPTYAPIVDGVLSTYPQHQNIVSAMHMTNNTEIVSGTAKTGSKVQYLNGYAKFNASNSSYINAGDVVYGNTLTVVTRIRSPNTFVIGGIMGDMESGVSGFSVGQRDTRTLAFIYSSAFSKYASVNSLKNNTWTHLAYTVSNVNATHSTASVSVNSVPAPVGSSTLATTLVDAVRDMWIGHGRWYSFTTFDMDEYQVYNIIPTGKTLDVLYAGGDGITFKTNDSNFVGYNVASGTEKIISTGGTCTAIGLIDTSYGTRKVTIRTYYTQDTTKTSQSSDADFHNISIVHNPGVVITNGTIVRQIPPLYTGTAVLDSNNTNAVMTQNRTHFTIYTGALTASDWYEYNVSVPNNADHGMWLNRLLQWAPGVGWNFVGDAPADYTDDISDEITVTVS